MEAANRRTLAGTPVLIFQKIGDYQFGAYLGSDDNWYPARWDKQGRYHRDTETALDLKDVS